MRLDKYLAQAGMGTRSEVKKYIRSGRVEIDGETAKRPEEQVDKENRVVLDGKPVYYEKFEYYMLHKPAGVVSATTDDRYTTVVELITEPHARDIFPVGRLDKDTEGLLILTNDGALAHELLSPRKHVSKTYFVRVEGKVTKEDKELFAQGMDIGDEKPVKPARLFDEKFFPEMGQTEVKIQITEGRYHQIKRMFAKIHKPVCYLKRLSMGNLCLDETLEKGAFRKLTQQEISLLRNGEKKKEQPTE